ncbi:basal complex transmembrane protein 1, putative [Plasmodium berghei ANKA]|uniref:Basal complex transmembrane protein 1, putative n=1 Tax=Plasmodium berghei (strain Anka) TaxID=5823 RepID=A0A509ADP9_PLABA|nr:basal complex transmembrane protein 1, putative [Plasmodium berghei ANKA]VUC53835.1 basal complex transmembrane protein 1, putative [Plasmodium berghei ANKA]|eukprot:XP_034419699.1 basal complex transmembrane protein 1, putative [Plasmodium berghei ANKA]
MDNITVNINNSNDFNEIIHEIKSKQLCNESIKSSKMAKLKLTTQKVNGNDNDGTKMINEFEEYMNKRVPNKNKNKKETTLHKLKSEQNLRKRNLSDTPIFPRITSLILDHEKDNSNSDYSYKTKNTKDYKINKYVSNNKFEKSSIYDIYAKTLKKLSIEEENNEESYYNDSNNITQEKKNKNINRTDIHINESDTSLHNSTSIYETQNSSIEKNRNYLKEKAIRNKDINIKGRKQKSDLIHRYNMNDSENVNFNTSRGNDTKDSYYNSFENSNLSSDHYAYKNKKKNKKENTFYYTNEERNKTYSNESDFSHENLSVEGNVNYRKGDNNNEINNIAENGNNLNDHNSLSIENHKYKKEEAKNDHLIKKKKKKTLNYSDNHSEKDGSTKSLKIGNEMNMYHSLNDKIYKKRSAIYSKESLKYDKSDITTTDSEYYMNDKYQKYIKKQIPSIEDDYKHKEKLLKIVNSKNILSIRKILIIMREFYIGFIGLQLIYFITYLLFGNNSVYLIQIISISCTFFSLLDANYHGYLLNGFIDMCIAIFLNIAIIENIAGFITLQSNSVLKNITISNVVFLYFFSIFSFLNSYFIYKLHSLERKNIKYVIESIESKVNNDVKNKA